MKYDTKKTPPYAKIAGGVLQGLDVLGLDNHEATVVLTAATAAAFARMVENSGPYHEGKDLAPLFLRSLGDHDRTLRGIIGDLLKDKREAIGPSPYPERDTVEVPA